MIKSMGKAFIAEKMIEYILEIGLEICVMAKGNSLGLMAGNMKGNIKMTKNMGLVYLPGQMEANIKDYG